MSNGWKMFLYATLAGLMSALLVFGVRDVGPGFYMIFEVAKVAALYYAIRAGVDYLREKPTK